MIPHEKAAELYGAYFRNELSRETVREFHAHINDCEECKVRLRATRAHAGNPGFILKQGGESELRYREIVVKNRMMMFVVLAVLLCFLLLFRLAWP